MAVFIEDDPCKAVDRLKAHGFAYAGRHLENAQLGAIAEASTKTGLDQTVPPRLQGNRPRRHFHGELERRIVCDILSIQPYRSGERRSMGAEQGSPPIV